MIVQAPVFPHIHSFAFDAKSKCLKMDVRLHCIHDPVAPVVQIREKAYFGHQSKLDYIFTSNEEAYEALQAFLEDPQELAGVTLSFFNLKDAQWLQLIVKHLSLYGKKLYLKCGTDKQAVEVALHKLCPDEELV